MDYRCGLALPERHVERASSTKLRPEVRCHRPAHDPTAPHVQDHRQVQEASPRPDVRDVRHPELVWATRREVPIHQIRRRPCVLTANRRRRPLPRTHALDARRAHHSSHPIQARAVVLGLKIRVNPRRTVRPVTLLVEPLEGIDPVSRANQAVAFAKISRSIFTCRSSRRRRRSSSRSGVVSPSVRHSDGPRRGPPAVPRSGSRSPTARTPLPVPPDFVPPAPALPSGAETRVHTPSSFVPS